MNLFLKIKNKLIGITKRITAHFLSEILPLPIIRDARLFHLWERKGYHITPCHYSEPIPDTRTLRADLWDHSSEMVGLDINEERQINLLAGFVTSFKHEFDLIPLNKEQVVRPYDYYINNGSFESVDGEILYCFIRHFKPKHLFEIGSGHSTCLSAQAVLKNKSNGGNECQLIAYEPYPTELLKTGFPGLAKLVPSSIQDVPLSEFEKLEENDILFIDSSHVLKIGGDVQYEYLEILPRLKKGVIIHIHDIFMPAEYPKKWVLKLNRFWSEQYLLQAFLAFNRSFEVLWAGSFMHLTHFDLLENSFLSYKKDQRWPASFWVKKII